MYPEGKDRLSLQVTDEGGPPEGVEHPAPPASSDAPRAAHRVGETEGGPSGRVEHPAPPASGDAPGAAHRTWETASLVGRPASESRAADARSRKSKLRRMAVKLERYSSHRRFLTECRTHCLIPKGFRLKWKCHLAPTILSEASPRINKVLADTSVKLIELCLDLACRREQELNAAMGVKLQELGSEMEEQELSEFMSILSTESEAEKLKLDRTKRKKLRHLIEETRERTVVHEQPPERIERQSEEHSGLPQAPPVPVRRREQDVIEETRERAAAHEQSQERMERRTEEHSDLPQAPPVPVRRQDQHEPTSPASTGTPTPQGGTRHCPDQSQAGQTDQQGAHTDANTGTSTYTAVGGRHDRRPQDGCKVEVINLSKRPLSPDELSLLSKGLNFVPTAKQSLTKTVAQLKEWERLVRLREFWHNHERTGVNDDASEDDQYKESKWTPPKGRNPCLDFYLEEVTREIIHKSRHRVKGNLTKCEEKALSDLLEDNTIIIRPADKGSGVVVMDADDYKQRLQLEMQDGATYQSTGTDRTPAVQTKVKNLVQNLHRRGVIGKNQMRYMLASNPQPGRLQGNPKLHKAGQPLRTIVSGRGHATERVAEIAEKELAGHVESQDSYLKDTTHFLQRLEEIPQPLPGGPCAPILFCMDVQKLYPSVPQKEGMEACRAALDQRKGPKIPTEDVLKMIDLVLNNNNFNLDSNAHFVQTEGTAIGSKLGKNYACTYLGRWENELHARCIVKPLAYFRFCDDIFGIWLGGLEQLKQYHALANSIHPKIQVDLRHSETDIEFLDVRVLLVDGSLKTDLFSKPTDTKAYLHYTSDHPSHTKDAVPMGLAIRIKRICSDQQNYVKHRNELGTRLISRGYPKTVIDKSFAKVDLMNRKQLLKRQTQTTKATTRVPLVITYSSHLPNIRSILRSKRHILERSDYMKDIFSADPMVAYRKGRSLKDQLVHDKTRRFMSGQKRGRQDCGKNCVICRRMYQEADKVQGPRGTCTYDRTVGCKSSNVIYGVWCKLCSCVCYVGETGGTLYTRLSNHLSTIRTDRSSAQYPVAMHFNSPGHSIDDVMIVGLERVWSRDVIYRRIREARWIDMLGTSQLHGGLNVKTKL